MKFIGNKYFMNKQYDLELMQMIGLVTPKNKWVIFYIAMQVVSSYLACIYYFRLVYESSEEAQQISKLLMNQRNSKHQKKGLSSFKRFLYTIMR